MVSSHEPDCAQPLRLGTAVRGPRKRPGPALHTVDCQGPDAPSAPPSRPDSLSTTCARHPPPTATAAAAALAALRMSAAVRDARASASALTCGGPQRCGSSQALAVAYTCRCARAAAASSTTACSAERCDCTDARTSRAGRPSCSSTPRWRCLPCWAAGGAAPASATSMRMSSGLGCPRNQPAGQTKRFVPVGAWRHSAGWRGEALQVTQATERKSVVGAWMSDGDGQACSSTHRRRRSGAAGLPAGRAGAASPRRPAPRARCTHAVVRLRTFLEACLTAYRPRKGAAAGAACSAPRLTCRRLAAPQRRWPRAPGTQAAAPPPLRRAKHGHTRKTLRPRPRSRAQRAQAGSGRRLTVRVRRAGGRPREGVQHRRPAAVPRQAVGERPLPCAHARRTPGRAKDLVTVAGRPGKRAVAPATLVSHAAHAHQAGTAPGTAPG